MCAVVHYVESYSGKGEPKKRTQKQTDKDARSKKDKPGIEANHGADENTCFQVNFPIAPTVFAGFRKIVRDTLLKFVKERVFLGVEGYK